tara:strand:+ start:272 stop:544 length:273 start_codon:yes stop_codon:yes gene_type:complete
MNIYNILVIVLVSYLIYKNKKLNQTEIITTVVILQIFLFLYLKNKSDSNIIKNRIYDEFESERIYNYYIQNLRVKNDNTKKELNDIFNLL